MARTYRRTKSRLARRQGKIFVRQAVGIIFVIVVLILLVTQFGIPLLIKLAVLVGGTGSSTDVSQSADASVLVAPTLKTLPEATFSARLNIGGFTQANNQVALFVNGTKVDEETADDSGGFEFSRVQLRSGKNRIWAVSSDENDNTSQESSEMIVVRDSNPPVVTVDSPSEGEEFADSEIEVRGIVDESVSITINNLFVLQKNDDSFVKTIQLSGGENIILITATDAAGNTSTREVRVNYSE